MARRWCDRDNPLAAVKRVYRHYQRDSINVTAVASQRTRAMAGSSTGFGHHKPQCPRLVSKLKTVGSWSLPVCVRAMGWLRVQCGLLPWCEKYPRNTFFCVDVIWRCEARAREDVLGAPKASLRAWGVAQRGEWCSFVNSHEKIDLCREVMRCHRVLSVRNIWTPKLLGALCQGGRGGGEARGALEAKHPRGCTYECVTFRIEIWRCFENHSIQVSSLVKSPSPPSQFPRSLQRCK